MFISTRLPEMTAVTAFVAMEAAQAVDSVRFVIVQSWWMVVVGWNSSAFELSVEVGVCGAERSDAPRDCRAICVEAFVWQTALSPNDDDFVCQESWTRRSGSGWASLTRWTA